MFCPNCGKAEQTENSYCRSCGEFITFLSNKFDFFYKCFGVNTIEKQVAAGLILNAVVLLSSVILFILLQGHFDGGANKNPPIETPRIIYIVYAFLISVSFWQLLNIILGLNIKAKLPHRKNEENKLNYNAPDNKLADSAKRDFLPPADFSNVVPASIVDNTTNKLVEPVIKRSL